MTNESYLFDDISSGAVNIRAQNGIGLVGANIMYTDEKCITH